MHFSSFPNMVRVPGKHSLQLWPLTNTPLKIVHAVSYKSKSWRPGFPQTSSSSMFTSLSVSLSNAWPDSHWNAYILFSHAGVCFQVAIHGNLVFLSSFADIFAANRSCCSVFFPPYFPESLVIRSACQSLSSWGVLSSFWARSAMLAIASHCIRPILPLFISKQSSVSVAGNMKRITCCAVEDFSCNRPAWHRVFTTTNTKAFTNRLQFEAPLCRTVSDGEQKNMYSSENATDS